MPAWAEWIEIVLAGIGLAALMLVCMAAEVVWTANAPVRRARKRQRQREAREAEQAKREGT